MSLKRIFWISCLISTIIFFGLFTMIRQRSLVVLDEITPGIFVSGQIHRGKTDLVALEHKHIKTVIDCRPDGEASDQPSSADMATWLQGTHRSFHYIPVEHTGIPVQAAVDLAEVLQHADHPVLLYCRTGNRAVRTYALVIAAQADGPSEAMIIAMVKSTGHSVEDMIDEIHARVQARPHPAKASP